MTPQEKIKERYKLIQDKTGFLTACKPIQGFNSCAYWFNSNKNVPAKHYNTMLMLIEKQLETDKVINEIKVQNYKVISDSNFS